MDMMCEGILGFLRLCCLEIQLRMKETGQKEALAS